MSSSRPLIVRQPGGGCVAAWNLAARRSRGDVLVQLSDDWLPISGWDEQFLDRLGDLRRPAVMRPSDGHRDDELLCMAILTRARLRQQQTLFHPGYTGLYSDDEFSFRAYQDGVVIDARDLVLTHDHPNYNTAQSMDETYLRQNDPERERAGRRLFLERNPRAKGHWIHEGEWRRHFVPLPAGQSWTQNLNPNTLRPKAEVKPSLA